MGSQDKGLPDLPPEWGEIVIPDDLHELDAEVAAVRRELQEQSSARHEPTPPADDSASEQHPLWFILLVLGVSVTVTLLSLMLALLPSLTGGATSPDPSPPATETGTG